MVDLDRLLHLDSDARASLVRFSYDVHRVVYASKRSLPTARLVTAYARALECRLGESGSSKAWITFYMWLEWFTRAAVRSIEPGAMDSVLAILLRFEAILDDDLGSQLFPATETSFGTASLRN